MKQIKSDAAKTPFDVAGLTQANQLLISAGLSAEESRETILALGNAVSATGGGNEELSRMAVNLQQIKNVGKASALDIKQFAYAGIDIYGLLADYLGVTKKEASEMEITWDNLNGALINASKDGGKYYGAMEAQSKTLNGQISNLQDGLNELLGNAVKPINEILSKYILPVINKFIASGPIAESIVISLAVAFGILASALSIQATINIVRKAFKALNLTLLGNPIVLIVAAIAGLVAGFLYLWKTNENFRKFWIKLWDNIKKTVTNVVKSIVTFFTKTIPNAIKRIVDNISQATQRIKSFFTNAWNSIRNVWLAVANWFKMTVVEPIKKVFNPLVDWFKKLFKSIWDFISSVFSVIGSLAKGCVDVIKAVWGIVANWFNNTVVKPISQFFSNAWNSIKNGALNAWNGIKNSASSALNGIKGVWGSVSSWFNNTIINPISNAFNNIWNKVKNGASNAWSGIRNIFSNVPSWFRNQFTSAWTNVKNVFSTGGKIFTGIKEGIGKLFKRVVQKIIDGINKVIKKPFETINDALKKIRDVTIIKLQPFKNLPRISIPQIPSIMEQGGVLKKGEVGLLEGNGAEAVVPLHQNRKWIRAVADDMRRAVLTENGAINANSIVRSNNGYNNIINAKFDIDGSVEIDGKRAGRIIAPYTMQTIKVGGGYR